MAAVLAPLTPAVLQWAMRDAGWTTTALAERLKVDAATVRLWIAGEGQPSTTQFRRLAALLKRPTSFFFLPTPPEDAAGLVSFRSAPGERDRAVMPSEAQAIRQARRVQQFTAWSLARSDEPVLGLPRAAQGASPEAAAGAFRAAIGWTLAEQMSITSAAVATRTLRTRIEDAGIVAMQFSLGEDGCRGFSLDHDVAPVIAINSAYIYEARAFSYLHEVGHILRRTEAICGGTFDQGLERWCEEFAAALLLPRTQVLAAVDELVGRGKSVLTSDQVTRLARRFKTSRLATVTALHRYERASQLLWNEVRRQSEFRKKSGGGSAGDPQTLAAIRLREWGRTPTRLLIDAADAGQISRPDLLEYLNLSSSQVAEVRERLRAGNAED